MNLIRRNELKKMIKDSYDHKMHKKQKVDLNWLQIGDTWLVVDGKIEISGWWWPKSLKNFKVPYAVLIIAAMATKEES